MANKPNSTSGLWTISAANGELVEIVVTHLDVTQSKRAEEERERLRQLESDLAHMNRVSMIVDRMRDHIKKAPPRKQRFDLNGAINEVIVLTRSAIAENGVSVQTRLKL